MGKIKKTIMIKVDAKNEEEMETKLAVFLNDIKFINREYSSNDVTYKIVKRSH